MKGFLEKHGRQANRRESESISRLTKSRRMSIFSVTQERHRRSGCLFPNSLTVDLDRQVMGVAGFSERSQDCRKIEVAGPEQSPIRLTEVKMANAPPVGTNGFQDGAFLDVE